LPTERAFVVQLYAGTDPRHGALTGRIEHVRSGHATFFESAEALLTFMTEAISGAGRSDGIEADDRCAE
jgi:hypothetical protein